MTMTTTDEIRSILDTLERAPDLIVPMVWEIPEERRKERPAPGKWSAHEHACHLADGGLESVMYGDCFHR